MKMKDRKSDREASIVVANEDAHYYRNMCSETRQRPAGMHISCDIGACLSCQSRPIEVRSETDAHRERKQVHSSFA